MAQAVHLRPYGVQTTLNFDLFEVDGVDFRVDAVHAAGDTVIKKDEGAEANTTNGFVDEGNGYSIQLSATEMQAARITVDVVDQTATKVWLDTEIVIETYGHPSSQHPTLGPLSVGTAAAIASGTITLASGHGLLGAASQTSLMVVLTGGTNAIGRSRIISWSSGDVFNVDPAWDDGSEVVPSGTITYAVYAMPNNPTGTIPAVDVTKLGGSTQSATDLKDFADEGYDPSDNKVQGVVLVDTTTTNSDMRGTDNALLAVNVPANFADLAITASTGRVTAGTVVDKTGYALTTAADEAIADALLGRNIAGGSNTGRTVTSALRRLRNRVAIAAGTMTVYQENDTTAAWTGAVTTAAGNPVSEIDPT